MDTKTKQLLDANGLKLTYDDGDRILISDVDSVVCSVDVVDCNNDDFVYAVVLAFIQGRLGF